MQLPFNNTYHKHNIKTNLSMTNFIVPAILVDVKHPNHNAQHNEASDKLMNAEVTVLLRSAAIGS